MPDCGLDFGCILAHTCLRAGRCLMTDGRPEPDPRDLHRMAVERQGTDDTVPLWTPAPTENPKDAQALRDGKVPLDLLEPTAMREIALAMHTGAVKYGRRNYIRPETRIRATTYIAAVRRHIDAFLEGEDCATDTGLSHWAHLGANVNVVLAAMAAGTFIDDRMPGGDEMSPAQHAASKRSNAQHSGDGEVPVAVLAEIRD